MTDEMFKEAYDIQKEIEKLEAELKEKKAEHKHCMDMISKSGLSSYEYEIRPAREPSRKAVTEWFKVNEPELYLKYAHVSHPTAVSIMSSVSGGYMNLQTKLREIDESGFDEGATISIEDLKRDLGDDGVRSVQEKGGIVFDKPSSYKVVLVPYFMSELMRKKSEEEAKV